MKAASHLRHIWVGLFFCGVFLAATGVAYAGANGKTGTPIETVGEKKQQSVSKQQQAPVQKKAETVVPAKENTNLKTAPKQTEVKKEESNTGLFSFSFLYYLFYKTNFAETTNNAIRSSWQAFISRMID